jgi:hypothetical protein
MPNGYEAMATIAIDEGRATRISDYTKSGRHLKNIPARTAGTQRAQEAKLKAGIAKRQQMAFEGRMTHGGGGIAWGGPRHKGKFQTTAGWAHKNPFKSYSGVRAKNPSYKAPASGASTSNWKSYRPTKAAKGTNNFKSQVSKKSATERAKKMREKFFSSQGKKKK